MDGSEPAARRPRHHLRHGHIGALLCLVAFLAGPSCGADILRVAVLGDSHSDVDRVPRVDWVEFASAWDINEQVESGKKCWQILPDALATPGTSFQGNAVVIYCGTNDAGRPDWDLAVTPIEVADLWQEVWSHPNPPSLYADGLHFGFEGRQLSFHTIHAAMRRAL